MNYKTYLFLIKVSFEIKTSLYLTKLNLDMNELSESEVQKQLKINPNTGYKYYIASSKVCSFNQLL